MRDVCYLASCDAGGAAWAARPLAVLGLALSAAGKPSPPTRHSFRTPEHIFNVYNVR